MIKLKDGVAAVRDALSGGGVTPSAPTNTHVELSSDAEPSKRQEGEYDGEMPKSNALVSDRSRVLKDIAARRDAQVVENAEEGNNVIAGTAGDNETAPDPEIQGEDIQVDGDGTQPPIISPAVPPAPVIEEMRTLIVDGKSIQVPVSKILERGTATFQKEVAADARLAEANRLLAQAQEFAKNAQPPKESQAPAIEAMNDEELGRLIQFGSPEQATQAIKLIRASAQPAIKVEDIVRQVRQEIPTQMAFEKGKEYAITEYGDLLQDPDLGAIFLNRENVARAAGDTRSHRELYKAIGEDMRTKFNRPKLGADGAALPTPKPVVSTVPVRTMEEKRELKANAPSLPRLASSRLDGDATTPRPPSRAEMFASMRRARGFQQGKDL